MTQEHGHALDRLDHFLDGELPEAERLAVEEHLGRCDHCLTELEGLRGLRDAARSLPREIAPPRDLWAGIAARIEAAPAREETRVVQLDFSGRRRISKSWVIRIAAAVALVVVSSGATALLLGRGESPATVVVTVPAAVPESSAGAALAAFRPTELEYTGAVEVLSAELEARKAELAPATVAAVEESLMVIDLAIEEARAALERDPSNAELPFHLSGVYRKKVELLQQAVQLPQGS